MEGLFSSWSQMGPGVLDIYNDVKIKVNYIGGVPLFSMTEWRASKMLARAAVWGSKYLFKMSCFKFKLDCHWAGMPSTQPGVGAHQFNCSQLDRFQ